MEITFKIKNYKKAISFLSIALIVGLGFIVYFNSLYGKFIWDDEHLVKNNQYIRQWDKTGYFFSGSIGAGSDLDYNSYRPLQMLSYTLDYSFWRINAAGFHLTNILLHILVALSVYWLVSILFHSQPVSLLTSIIFIVHPVHTEAISYISGRADPLACLFLLLSIIFYLKHARSEDKYQYILSLILYALALLSKENSLVLPLLLLLCSYIYGNKFKSRYFLPILAISLAYAILRMTFLKFNPSFFVTTNFFQRLPGFFAAITEYFRLLLVPFDLHMEYGRRMFGLGEPRAIFGALTVFTLLIYSYKRRREDKVLFFSLSWFFVALLPQSNIFPINAFMAEHWLYLPSIGFFLILAQCLVLLYRIKKLRVLTIILTSYILLFYAYSTIRQNNYWREPVGFYERTLKYAPGNPLIYYNLGNSYSQNGNNKEAAHNYLKAIEINPRYSDAYNNLCNTYLSMNENGKAIESCGMAIEINPKAWRAYYNLGCAYDNIGKKKEAIGSYEKAVGLNNNYVEAVNNLASLYADGGDINKAIRLWNKAIEIKPDFSTAHFNLAVFYFQQKKYALAIYHCDKVSESGSRVDPEFLKLLKPYRNVNSK